MELFLAQVTDVFLLFLFYFHAFSDHLYIFKKGIDKCIHWWVYKGLNTHWPEGIVGDESGNEMDFFLILFYF